MFNKILFLTLALSLQVFGLVSGDAPGTPVGQGIRVEVPDAPVRHLQPIEGNPHNNDRVVRQLLFLGDGEQGDGAQENNQNLLNVQIQNLQFQIILIQEGIQAIIQNPNNQQRLQLLNLQAQLAALQAQLQALQEQLPA